VSLLAAACSGEDGLKGDPGAKGDTGATGPAGADGATGPTGSSGSNGSDGGDGSDGSNGSNGSAGAAGATGATGATGGTGGTGAPGSPGPSGVDGDSTHANIALSSMQVEPDTAVDLTGYLTGFESGETIVINLIDSDGGATLWGDGTAGASGAMMAELTHAGLDAGLYSVEVTGGDGGKASTALVSSPK
jgi:collagen type VII alpha